MNNSFNTNIKHPLIQRQQTYVLEKKLLAVHSEDRDYTQFPNSNHFSLDIGEAMTNVESVRLVSYAFPNNCYNISTSYQNTKLVYNYNREYIFDTSTLPLVKPTLSSENEFAGGPNPPSVGQADYRLGMFQSVLENLYPGIIRPFITGAGVVQTPDNGYIPGVPGGQFDSDWNSGLRGMIYTSDNTVIINGVPQPSPNFGTLGLPDDVDVLYEEDVTLDWISIKNNLPYQSGVGGAWPDFIAGWTANAPVPETTWTGRFKIVFSLENNIITIPEGAYSPDNLANTIANKINEQIMSYANSLGHQLLGLTMLGALDVNNFGRMRKPFVSTPTTPSSPNGPYVLSGTPFYTGNSIKNFQPIVVKYNELTNNLLIGASEGSFHLLANEKIPYSFDKCSPNKFMFSQYTKWGLPYYMGFNKEIYDSIDINFDEDILLNDDSATNSQPLDISNNPIKNVFLSNLNGLIIYNNQNSNWITPSGGSDIVFYNQASPPSIISYDATSGNANRTVSILSSPNNVSLMGEDCIYMEMEKFNNINEIYPFSERTNTMYNCDYGHKSDSAFAIIPLTQTPFGTELGNRTSMNTNVFISEPPIKNINRLEFKFRYHDGRLVDFKNLPYSFVLEFNMLREEQARNKEIRIPHLY